MKGRSLVIAALLTGASASAAALDTAEIMRKAKAYAVPAPAPAPGNSGMLASPAAPNDPFVVPASMFDVAPRSDRGEARPRGACENNGSNLCYDVDSRRVVYRPVRKYMPTVDGLTPENISVKRDGIVLKYSFK